MIDATGVKKGYGDKLLIDGLDFTQTVEVVASKPVVATPGAKRRMDTCRVSYLIENKGKQNRRVSIVFR